jgi:hypothetical protein
MSLLLGNLSHIHKQESVSFSKEMMGGVEQNHFFSTWVWTQGMLSRQVLYCLNQASSSFFSGYFGDRVLLSAHTGLDLDPSILSFPQCLGWQALPPCPDFFHWVGSLTNVFAWVGLELMILPISTSQEGRITGMSHWHPAEQSFWNFLKNRSNLDSYLCYLRVDSLGQGSYILDIHILL